MQGGVMARLGAKLEYYKKLKGVCQKERNLFILNREEESAKLAKKHRKELRLLRKLMKLTSSKLEELSIKRI